MDRGELVTLREEALMKDADHMVASGDDLAWLMAQLACWPTRVDPECTTNDRFLRMSATATLKQQAEEIERLREGARAAVINSPETADFMAAVPLEAAFQREQWGVAHNAGKTPFDWFWLIGYLSQKAAASAVAGDDEKARHHTISTAAALANWHAALAGLDTSMRPGIEPPDGEDWVCDPCDATNRGIRQRCRFCKKSRSEAARAALTKEQS